MKARAALQRHTLKLLGSVKRAWYLRQELPLAAAASPRPLRILFSEHDGWERSARASFAGTAHTVYFAPLAQTDLSRFDLIVPLSLADAHYMRDLPERIRAHRVPLPDPACADLCDDRLRLNTALASAGFSAHLPPTGADLAPPFVCKPLRAESHTDCLLVPDYGTILRLGTALDQPGLLRQAAVPGLVEYATHFLMRDGQLVRELTVAHHHDKPLYIRDTASQGSEVRVIGRCPDAALLAAMLRAIGYNGLGCINFKMAHGRLQLMSIDPRIDGGLMAYFATFLRSLPQAQRSHQPTPSRWSWLDSVIEPQSLGRA